MSKRIAFVILFFIGCHFLSFGQTLERHIPGQLIVMLDPGLDESYWDGKSVNINGESVFLNYEKTLSERIRIHLVSFDPQYSENDVLQAVFLSRGVQLAQFNHQVQRRGVMATSPNDPNFGVQWDMDNTGQSGGVPDADIDGPEAWDITTGGMTILGDTIVVAVIDGGVDLGHEDLNLWKNHGEIPSNGIDDDNNGYVDDYDGWNAYGSNGNVLPDAHGTHVSGTVGAIGDNGIGVTGVNWDVQVMPISGSSGNEATVVEAYGYVLEMRARYNQSNGAEGAFVVSTNASFGVDFGDPANYPIWCAMYDSLGIEGILSAGATANLNIDIDATGDVPTACASDYMLAVTNTTRQDQKNGGAAFGLTTIDLGAPGTAIQSTLPNDSYGNFTGTSMATPHVAGAVALLLSYPCPNLIALYKADPATYALTFRDFLLDGVDTIPALSGITVTGGRLNLANSLELMQQQCGLFGDCPAVVDIFSFSNNDTSAFLEWTATDSASNYHIRYRVEGDSLWQSGLDVSDTSYVIQNLEACTTYELQVESVCPNDSSGFFISTTFKTEGCCEPPANLQLSGVSNDAFALKWSEVYGALEYRVRYRAIGDSIWDFAFISDTIGSISGLLPCTRYEYSVSTVCTKPSLEESPLAYFNTGGCEVCVDTIYCEPAGTNTLLWIDSISLGPLQSQTGPDDGYGFFADYASVLELGTPYEMTIGTKSTSPLGSRDYRVWIDGNGDGNFSNLTELVVDTISLFESYSEMIVIPETWNLGRTRIRVATRLTNSSLGPIAPCDTIPFGEYEDYCINLVAPCRVPEGLEVSLDSVNELVSLNWDDLPLADMYVVNYSIEGDTIVNQETVNDSELTISLDNLDSCTTYQFSVQMMCVQGLSGASVGDTVLTLGCRSSTSIESQTAFGFKIYPNPAEEVIYVSAERVVKDVEIVDLSGKTVLRQAIGQTNDRIEIGKLSPGLYILKASIEGVSVFKRIVIQR